MKLPDLIPDDHEQRRHAIIDSSWKNFQPHFLGGRHPILKESSVPTSFCQHHFNGRCAYVTRDDRFFVDSETKCEKIKNKNKYLDIPCSFENAQYHALSS